MSVADSVDIGTAAIDEQVHAQFGGGLAASGQALALHVGDHQVVGGHQALAHGRGRGEEARMIQAHGNIAVGGGHEMAGMDPAAGEADVAPVFVLGLAVTVRDGFPDHWFSGGLYLQPAPVACAAPACSRSSLATRLS